MTIKSLGNSVSSFRNRFGGTGNRASKEVPSGPKATGGLISFFGGKTIHTFTSSGTFATTPNWAAGTSVEYLLVGGGGSGGAGQNNTDGQTAGGGAGGWFSSTLPISSGSYTVTVGSGGAARTGADKGNDGNPSNVNFPSPISVSGGGAGGSSESPSSYPGNPGGSGGGAANGGGGAAVNFPGPTQQGFPGGSGNAAVTNNAGGGGGAGGAGTNVRGPGNPPSAPGGIGKQAPATFIDPSNPYGTSGPNPGSFYFGGGGGAGGTASSTTAGSGGAGGGGAGGNYPRVTPGFSGTTNTGGGGGGSSAGDSTSVTSGAGGSGIVIIAYPS